ncbi:MAG: MBL fold metallo-hydrolase [Lachnospiraceae bacterium]|nr:MBL fold metallo-hydrolase [Lachnospiraceae bacterium]
MMDIMQLGEGTYRIDDDRVRFFVLEGKDKAIMIDSSMNNANAIDGAKKVTDKPLEIVNTHADRDHIAGNVAFEKMYMSPAEEPVYRENGGKGTIIPVKEGDIIDLGDRPLEVIDIPGHTPGSIALLDIKNRVLYSGDTVQSGIIFMFGKNRNMDTYIESLKKLEKIIDRFDLIYPSHDRCPVKPDIIPKLIEGANQVREGKAEGREMDLFGNKVMMYRFEYAGFFCEL